MFKVNQKVRRNPKVWPNDKTVFTIVAVEKGRFLCQRPGKERCPFSGEMKPHLPMPYLKSELVAA